MPRWMFVLAALAMLGLGPSEAVPPAAGGAFASGNVDLVANVPDAPAIGGRILDDYLYVTGAQGLRIYDIKAAGRIAGAAAGVPVPVGALELPNVENEDVDTNGQILLISADHLLRYASVLYVIDVRNKNLPVLLSETVMPWGYDTGHTATCINGCSSAWLTGGTTIYVVNLTNPARPTIVGSFPSPGSGWGSHDVEVDSAGIAWLLNTAGAWGFRTGDSRNPGGTALSPQPWAGTGIPTSFILHNALRPNADKWAPRAQGDNSLEPRYGKGELLLIGEEIWMATDNGLCSDSGDFITASVIQRSTDAAPVIRVLDRFDVMRSQSRSILERKPAGAVACSTHYFSEKDGIAAVAWYEEGVRFLDFRDPHNVTEIGYYMPAVTEVWATLWNRDADVIYTFDVARGIDVLRFSI